MRIRYPIFVLTCVVGGGVVGVWGQGFTHGNKDAVDLLVNVFSILAGFLVAIMSLHGGDLIDTGKWRRAIGQQRSLQTSLIRQRGLFYLYLSTLALIFICRLIGARYPQLVSVLESLYFWLGTTAFMLSFGLPAALLDIQSRQIDRAVDEAKKGSSFLDRN